ncbi:MAG TPA: hypothetical protein VJZ73_04225 [Methylomirabilota bacterium]|nr:hypothetical protein [Methylomirabilota bacterium]
MLTLYVSAIAAVGPLTVNGVPVGRFAWTFALPNTPFAQFEKWYSSGLAAFLVLVVSAGLGMIAPLMQRKLSA